MGKKRLPKAIAVPATVCRSPDRKPLDVGVREGGQAMTSSQETCLLSGNATAGECREANSDCAVRDTPPRITIEP